MQIPHSALKRIVPFYTTPHRTDLYRDFDTGLINSSRILCCYCTRKNSIEYCSVHIIIPARIPSILLDIMNESDTPPYTVLSGPYSGLCYFESDFTSDNPVDMQAKISRIPEDIKSWETVTTYVTDTPGLRALTKQASTPFHTNRASKYIRKGQRELRKIIDNDESILYDDPDIQEALEELNINWIAASQFIHEQFSPDAPLMHHMEAINADESSYLDKVKQMHKGE